MGRQSDGGLWPCVSLGVLALASGVRAEAVGRALLSLRQTKERGHGDKTWERCKEMLVAKKGGAAFGIEWQGMRRIVVGLRHRGVFREEALTDRTPPQVYPSSD